MGTPDFLHPGSLRPGWTGRDEFPPTLFQKSRIGDRPETVAAERITVVALHEERPAPLDNPEVDPIRGGCLSLIVGDRRENHRRVRAPQQLSLNPNAQPAVQDSSPGPARTIQRFASELQTGRFSGDRWSGRPARITGRLTPRSVCPASANRCRRAWRTLTPCASIRVR